MSAPSFRTAADLARREPPLAAAGIPAAEATGLAVVSPDISLDQATSLWNTFLAFRGEILGDPACFDVIDGSKVMNRTGAMRLALPFGLSIEERELTEGRVELADTNDFDYRYLVRVTVSKGNRKVDGIGSCRLSEIEGKMDLSRREHFALTRAWTRAAKRAIADILGGTDAD